MQRPGAAIVREKEVLCYGRCPPKKTVLALAESLLRTGQPLAFWNQVGEQFASLGIDPAMVSGMLAVASGESPEVAILWFRPEIIPGDRMGRRAPQGDRGARRRPGARRSSRSHAAFWARPARKGCAAPRVAVPHSGDQGRETGGKRQRQAFRGATQKHSVPIYRIERCVSAPRCETARRSRDAKKARL